MTDDDESSEWEDTTEEEDTTDEEEGATDDQTVEEDITDEEEDETDEETEEKDKTDEDDQTEEDDNGDADTSVDEDELKFKYGTISLLKIMNEYCKRTGLDRDQIVFTFKGRELKETDSPDFCEMKEGDFIEAYKR